ncbi:MAG: motif putative anchor domain protein [Gemmatimonadetes bacterium]|nr:motif putative anchor domain protein [Gemmatimonadota bacterium]
MDGATITDASDWSIAESGDAIFLSSLGGNGIGGCAFAAAVNGIGQFVAIAPGNTVDGCSADICEVTPIVVTPEPSTIALALTGLVGLAGVRSRRRSHRDTLTTINGEA